MKKYQPSKILFGFLEIFGVLLVFYVFAAWPIPDSNEAHYIGKAIHFWNPLWIPNDPFLDSKDSHLTFYIIFGWLSYFYSPHAIACIGRALSWALLAWSWKRLSHTLLPVPFLSILTALALAYYVNAFHMAGEWLLGGVEGKSFAFAFVFFGLDAMLRNRWHSTWIFLGIASAFHVLVGGWSVLVVGFVRCCSFISKNRDNPHSATQNKPKHFFYDMFCKPPWGLFLGGTIAMLGLLPALFLDVDTPSKIVQEARQIYVFERLYHHLVPYKLPWTYPVRFFLLVVLWISCCRAKNSSSRKLRYFDLFIWGTLGLSAVGFVAAYGLQNRPDLAAQILRFYWFRLADIAIPMGIAIGGTRRLIPLLQTSLSRLASIFNRDLKIAPNIFILAGLPFLLYLFLDWLLFGQLFFSWSLQPEQGIPWLATLLACYVILKCFNVDVDRQNTSLLVFYFAILIYAPFDSFKQYGDQRTRFSYARTEPASPRMAYYWIDACQWIARPENTPTDARFWVPIDAATFKWHARRSDVGTWKDVPQDADSVVHWYRSMKELFDYGNPEARHRSLAVHLWWKTDEEIELLRQKYHFDYILCTASLDLSKLKSLHIEYENEAYRVYRIKPLY